MLCWVVAITVKAKVKVKVKEKEKKIEAPSAKWGWGGRERVRDSKLQKTECPLLVPQNSADKISVGLLFKPVAQIETVTTMSHSPPMGARQHHCLYYPGFLTTTLVSTIPFPLTLTTCLLFLSLSISVFVRETLFSFFLFLPIYT